MSALPSLQDELNRKAFQTIEWLTHAFDNARISEAQLSTGVDALFMATSGLVDGGILTLVTQASTLASHSPTQVRRHFIKADAIISLTWAFDETQVSMVRREKGRATGQVLAAGSPALAKDRLRLLANALLSRGFEEI